MKILVSLVYSINTESKEITTSLGISSKINSLSGKHNFFTEKYHKYNFPIHPAFCPINHRKSEVGMIRQKIKIMCVICCELPQSDQWKRTRECISWFHEIKKNIKQVFIKYDIKDVYQLKSEKSLLETQSYAKQFIKIFTWRYRSSCIAVNLFCTKMKKYW